MTRDEMITAIDGEIDRLERVRTLIQQSNSDRFALNGKLVQGFAAQAAARSAGGEKGKRTLSPEARKRIALAQKRRWAKQKAGRA